MPLWVNEKDLAPPMVISMPIYLLMLFCLCSSAFAEDGMLFSLSQKGHDASGMIIDDKLEIFSNYQVTWSTASKGFPCPSEAGIFSGKISKQNLDRILKFAPKIKRQENARGEVHSAMSYREEGSFKSFPIKTSGQHYQQLDSELSFLKSILLPDIGVALDAQVIEETAGTKVLAKFKLLGKNKLTLAMPATASEAFYFQNHARIVYAKPPAARLITLDSASPELRVEFAFPKGYKLKGNALYYHRSLTEPKMEILLCAAL